MGWYFVSRPDYMSDLEFFQREWRVSADIGQPGFKILRLSRRGNNIWMLCRTDAERAFPTTVILLIKTIWDRKDIYNFGYKQISECMGPCDVDCPVSFIKAASVPANEAAKQWRAAVMEHHASLAKVNKLKHGQWLRFEQPLKFSNGVRRQYLRVSRNGRGAILLVDSDSAYYRVRKRVLATATPVSVVTLGRSLPVENFYLEAGRMRHSWSDNLRFGAVLHNLMRRGICTYAENGFEWPADE